MTSAKAIEPLSDSQVSIALGGSSWNVPFGDQRVLKKDWLLCFHKRSGRSLKTNTSSFVSKINVPLLDVALLLFGWQARIPQGQHQEYHPNHHHQGNQPREQSASTMQLATLLCFSCASLVQPMHYLTHLFSTVFFAFRDGVRGL